MPEYRVGSRARADRFEDDIVTHDADACIGLTHGTRAGTSYFICTHPRPASVPSIMCQVAPLRGRF